MIIADKIVCSISRSLPMFMLTNIKNSDVNTKYFLQMARKPRKSKSSIEWETPLSEHDLTVDKVVDKTGKPQKVDDEMVKTFKTPKME